MNFDYGTYGAFKNTSGSGGNGRFSKIARWFGLRNRYIRFFRNARRDAPLVEIGCGDGAFLDELISAGFTQVRGLEPSPSYANVADHRLIVRSYAHEYLAECAPASLGTVVAFDVFEHIPLADLRSLFMLLCERLMTDGIVIFRVPNLTSPLSLANYFGDLSHVTPLTEVSIRQLVFRSGLQLEALHPEPLAYPRSLLDLVGIGVWLIYRLMFGLVLRAFGIRRAVLTPNLVCILRKQSDASTDD